MLGDRYIVVQGDNLWRIAAKQLGSGKQWPRIWRYNNRRSVVRVTGRGVPNPDLIRVGQVLLIPRLPTETRAGGDNDQHTMSHLPTATLAAPTPAEEGLAEQASKQPVRGAGRTLSERAKRLRSPLSYKYRLDIRWPAQDVGAAVLEARMTGDLVLMSKKAYPAAYVTKSDFEYQVTAEANHAFGQLVSDNRFIYDASEKRLTYRSLLVSQSKTPNVPATAIGVEMSSNSPIPKLRAEIRIAKLEGNFQGFLYTALDQKLVVEITPKPQPPTTLGPSKQPVVTANSSRAPEASTRSNALAIAIGAGIIVAGDLLVVAALVDDFIPIVGFADDIAAISLAGTMVAEGLALMGASDAALPRASSPAYVKAQVSVINAKP